MPQTYHMQDCFHDHEKRTYYICPYLPNHSDTSETTGTPHRFYFPSFFSLSFTGGTVSDSGICLPSIIHLPLSGLTYLQYRQILFVIADLQLVFADRFDVIHHRHILVFVECAYMGFVNFFFELVDCTFETSAIYHWL